MNEQPSIEDRIAARTDLAVAGKTEISAAVGGLAFRDMGQVMEFAKLMSVSGQAVPKHLRAQPGACLAVSLQALNWRMDPFAVANKSYAVNDRIAYEAQLIHAVIEQRAPIKGRIKGTVSGEGDKRRWTLRAQPTDDDEAIIFEGVEIGKITTKNSPLWKSDPDQQLWYYTVRAMCRRHFPDVILGVYDKEEIEAEPGMRDVTPQESGFVARAKAAKPKAEPEVITPHWTSFLKPSEVFPGSDIFTEGAKAFQAGQTFEDNPHEGSLDEANDWAAGWCGASLAAAEGEE
jgi:hypothetical protein